MGDSELRTQQSKEEILEFSKELLESLQKQRLMKNNFNYEKFQIRKQELKKI